MVLAVDLVFSILDGYDFLDDDPLVDVSLGYLNVDALVHLLVDVVADVLSLHSQCRCQLAYCWCSGPVSDGLLEVDDKVETILPHMMLPLDDSIQCLDATLHDEVDGDANLDVLLLASSSDDIHDVDHDPNNHDEVANDATRLLDTLPNDDPTPLLR